MLPKSRPRLALALVPVPFPGETPPSYARRVDAATEAPPGHLWGLALALHREHSGLDARERIPDRVAEQAVLALLHDLVGEYTQMLGPLGHARRIVWHACQLCTSGTIVALRGDSTRLVCPIHRVWTGPTIAPPRQRLCVVPKPSRDHSGTVSAETTEAEARLFDSQAPRRLIDDVLRRASSAVRRDWNGLPAPEDLPIAAAILETVCDPSIGTALGDPLCDYPEAYSTVGRRMAAAGNPAGDFAVDEAWLLLRWTAAAARYRWAGEPNTEDPDPIVQPIQPVDIHGPVALTPFHTYLDCLRTSDRDDECWWDDRYIQAGSRSRNLCPEGHVLARRPSKDHKHAPYDTSCPVCSGHKVIPGYNSFADLLPNVAQEWDPEAPLGPTPSTVSLAANRMGYWKCPHDHRYKATFANRALRGSGCPYCSHQKIVRGQTDLGTTHPRLAAMWHPDADNRKTPAQLSAGNSDDPITWRCPFGHAFVRRPAKLVKTDGRCPVCDGTVLVRGKNDLATKRPDVAALWHPWLNGSLTPSEVRTGSAMKVHWQCPNGHEYQMVINARCQTQKLTCPIETGRRLVAGVSDLATLEPLLILDWDDELNGCRPDQVGPGHAKRWWTCTNGHTQHTSLDLRRKAGGCTRCPPEQRVAPRAARRVAGE